MRINLKADDLYCDSKGSDRWHRFVDLCIELGVTASVGFIGRKVYQGESEDSELVDKIVNSGCFEVWNHSLTHQRTKEGVSDFYLRSYEEQKANLEGCSKIAKSLFGFTPTTFGPPYNKFCGNAIRVLQNEPNIDLIYDLPFVPGKRVIPMAYSVHADGSGLSFSFDRARRKSHHNLAKGLPFVAQIHPGAHWGNDDLEGFKHYIKYVKACGYSFVRSSELLV